MHNRSKLTLWNMKDEIGIYFNWSANALMPIKPGAADEYLKSNQSVIENVAQLLLKRIEFVPTPIYRGIILKDSVNLIVPHERLLYLSFSTSRAVAENFADVKGFGSDIVDVSSQLGEYGYVIEYLPSTKEVLFHYEFLTILPYAEAFSLLGMDGNYEVKSLKEQREVTILQPQVPFANITRMFER